jgi:2,4-dienoyl-CoA reductase-like NADH-dependent reductase (Old Yellow Enzyme family)
MMERTPSLFEPLSLGGITLANRIAVSSMCQYSAEGGAASDWHRLGDILRLADP